MSWRVFCCTPSFSWGPRNHLNLDKTGTRVVCELERFANPPWKTACPFIAPDAHWWRRRGARSEMCLIGNPHCLLSNAQTRLNTTTQGRLNAVSRLDKLDKGHTLRLI
jgi:hypothetical protein